MSLIRLKIKLKKAGLIPAKQETMEEFIARGGQVLQLPYFKPKIEPARFMPIKFISL